MMRRDVLKTLGAVAIGSTVGSIPSFASKKYRWRLALSVPKTLPIWGDLVSAFAKKVELLSAGDLKIKVYGAGELIPALGTFDAVKAGRVQMGHSASYYWQGKIPESVFFTSVPFGLAPDGMRSWIANGGQDLWDELYAPHGILAMPAGNTGMQMGGWFKKEIKTVADLKGLKMRVPGLGGKVLAQLGVKPVLVPGGEIYTSLSTGVIDATEWVGPYHDYIMGFHKVAPFYYYPGWHEPGPMLELMINKKYWSRLPKQLQEIIRVCAADLDSQMLAQWQYKDMEYLEKIKQETQVKVLSFPEPVLKEFKKISEKSLLDLSKSSPIAKKIYTSYQAFQSLYQSHLDVTARSYFEASRS